MVIELFFNSLFILYVSSKTIDVLTKYENYKKMKKENDQSGNSSRKK